MAKFFWEENSSTVEVIEEVTIAVGAAQVNSDSSALQLVVCPAPIDAQPRIPSLHWFLHSVVFNVAFLACLILLLDKKVFNNIAPAFMAYKKKWAFFHFGFIITGSAICYSLYAILISVLNKATGLWVGFLVVKIAGHTTGQSKHTTGQSSMRQATSVAGDAAVAEMKCTSRATRMVGSAALADKQCSDQAKQRASTPDLISTEVLEVIEAMSHHEFFIQGH